MSQNYATQFPYYWICQACATERGGIWPEDHAATIAEKICQYCDGKKQIEKWIAPWVDFDWPNRKTTSYAKKVRD